MIPNMSSYPCFYVRLHLRHGTLNNHFDQRSLNNVDPSCKFSFSKAFDGSRAIKVQIDVAPAVDGVMFTVKVVDAILHGDLRGVFFHLMVAPSTVIGIVGNDVTSFQKGPADSVDDLGKGATMQGDGGKHKYDIGVEIGKQGLGDDIGQTTFTVKGITFDQIDLSHEFGVRLTSVGKPLNRDDSSKVFGCSGCAAGSECYVCKNDNPFGMNDDGCVGPTKPNCMAEDDAEGSECYFCKNNNPFGTQDDGCFDLTKPNCKEADNAEGSECYFCKNDNPFGTKDDGCLDPARPNCMAEDRAEGSECYFCENDNPLGMKDDGCFDQAKPNCKAADQAKGSECYFCKNDNPLCTKDDGCVDPTKPNCMAEDQAEGSECYFCKNDNPLGTKDDGCVDLRKPNCKAVDGEAGQSCYFCKNDNPLGTTDDGCVNPSTPNCNATYGGEGRKCFPSCKFSISQSFDGGENIRVDILLAPTDNGGVVFKVTEADANLRGDLRGVFFHLTVAPSKVTTIEGKHVTSFQKGPANSVTNLGNGVNMQGDGGKHKYDIGVQIGTEGIAKDDIGVTTFIVKGITFAEIDFTQEFGVRLTSVGVPSNRCYSSKVFGLSGCAPAADGRVLFRHGSLRD